MEKWNCDVHGFLVLIRLCHLVPPCYIHLLFPTIKLLIIRNRICKHIYKFDPLATSLSMSGTHSYLQLTYNTCNTFYSTSFPLMPYLSYLKPNFVWYDSAHDFMYLYAYIWTFICIGMRGGASECSRAMVIDWECESLMIIVKSKIREKLKGTKNHIINQPIIRFLQISVLICSVAHEEL